MVSILVRAMRRLSKKLWAAILDRMKMEVTLPTIPKTPKISCNRILMSCYILPKKYFYTNKIPSNQNVQIWEAVDTSWRHCSLKYFTLYMRKYFWEMRKSENLSWQHNILCTFHIPPLPDIVLHCYVLHWYLLSDILIHDFWFSCLISYLKKKYFRLN